jgi:hypothetical protein
MNKGMCMIQWICNEYGKGGIDKKIEKLDIECLINLCVKFFTMCVYVLGAFVIFDNSLFVLLGANLKHL